MRGVDREIIRWVQLFGIQTARAFGLPLHGPCSHAPLLPEVFVSQFQCNVFNFITCTFFRASYHSGIEFDSWPGLKFLLQKVAQLNKAANLYKQAGAAWNLIALTLFELCLVQIR